MSEQDVRHTIMKDIEQNYNNDIMKKIEEVSIIYKQYGESQKKESCDCQKKFTLNSR